LLEIKNKSMVKTIVTTLLLFCLNTAYAQVSSNCKKAKKSDTTCWGWIQGHEAVDGGIVNKIQGKVVTPNDEPVANALIEVYDNPELDFDKRKRIAACQTGKNGEFSFKGLPSKKYELRGSICGVGFDAGHTVVTLGPKTKNASQAEILVTLNISQ
jgi:Carboxypeptidase regulatory-like domain